MKKIFLMFGLILSAKLLTAQTLTGKIFAPDGSPVPYANVALYQNLSGKLITGTISDTTGKFSINVSKNQELNDLMIVASFIGMINDTLRYKDFEGKSFLNIQLKPDDNLLDEISVTAFKSPIKISGGSILASVEHSVLSKMGSLDQMMNRIPFVSAKDGNMTVFGRGDAVVYLNGRKVLDKNILKQLSPNQIKNVEVITDPDSKYGSDINAVIKITAKNPSEGLGGNFSLKSEITNQLGGSVYARIIYVKNKWEVYTSADLTAAHYDYDYFDKTDFLNNNYLLESNVTDKYSCKYICPAAGINYSFSDDSNIGVRSVSMKSYETNDYVGSLRHFTNQDLDFEVLARDYNHSEPVISYLIFYYTKKFKNTALDFSNNNVFGKRPRTTDYTESAAEIFQNYVTKYRVNSFLLDFDTKFSKKFKLNYGAELTLTNDKQDFDFSTQNVETDLSSSSSERKQTLSGEYLSAKFSFEKFSFDLGLRYEHTIYDYYDQGIKDKDFCRTYDDWLPSYSFKYSPNSDISFSAGFRTTIKRPRYKQLDGKLSATDKYSYTLGNPLLQPYYRRSLNNIIKIYDFAIISSFENRKQYMSNDYLSDGEKLISRYCNLKNFWKNTIGAEWSSEFGFYEPEIEVDYSHQYLSGTFADKEIDYKTPVWEFSVSNGFSLPYDMFLSIDLGYSTKGHDVFDYCFETWESCASFSKEFKGGFSLTAEYEGFLVPKYEKSETKLGGFCFNSEETSFVREFSVTLSYVFNNRRLKYSGNKTSSEINRLDK
jgi:hypothetical protein